MGTKAVVGSSGSGKTTAALKLSHALNLTHIEMNALYHLPNWRHRTAVDFNKKYRRLWPPAERQDGCCAVAMTR